MAPTAGGDGALGMDAGLAAGATLAGNGGAATDAPTPLGVETPGVD